MKAVWKVVEDTDGHRWLVNPANGEWIAAFAAECSQETVDNVMLTLNAVEELLFSMKR